MKKNLSHQEAVQFAYREKNENGCSELSMWKKTIWRKNNIFEGMVVKKIVQLINQNQQAGLLRVWVDSQSFCLEYSQSMISQTYFSDEQRQCMKRKFLTQVSKINSSIKNFMKNYDYIQKFKENTFVNHFSDSQIEFEWE